MSRADMIGKLLFMAERPLTSLHTLPRRSMGLELVLPPRLTRIVQSICGRAVLEGATIRMKITKHMPSNPISNYLLGGKITYFQAAFECIATILKHSEHWKCSCLRALFGKDGTLIVAFTEVAYDV